MKENFFKTRIVTRSFVHDIIEGVRNRVGLRQRGYEEMVRDAAEELIDEAEEEYDVEWFRVDVNMVGRGSISVNVFGQGEPSSPPAPLGPDGDDGGGDE